MKKQILVVLLFFSFNIVFSQKTFEKWSASQQNDSYAFLIFEDSSCLLIKNSDTLIGNNFVFDTNPSKSKILIDTSVVPHQIDLIVFDPSLNYNLLTYKGIYEKLGNEKMRVRLNFGLGDRPNSFLPLGNKQTLIFIKKD